MDWVFEVGGDLALVRAKAFNKSTMLPPMTGWCDGTGAYAKLEKFQTYLEGICTKGPVQCSMIARTSKTKVAKKNNLVCVTHNKCSASVGDDGKNADLNDVPAEHLQSIC